MEGGYADFLGGYQIQRKEKKADLVVKQVGPSRYTVEIPEDAFEGVKDLRLQIWYTGDIGNAFIDGRLIHDNFSNGAVWEIGLKEFEKELKKDCITIYLTPIKEGVNVNVESAMAARSEEVKAYVAKLEKAELVPVYEMKIA